ncbi:hypothetical protein RCH09_002773 [Actimicrobium sp. GrIS 1.19]|uniref:hypothetical protein n=1 Tax=Actimicrobium sp. GrIS 1.19 TaxID=3071708 RepID=UPI002E06D011|nr:hypothetical protein [Actimicrobium sp. GrIS 1.19]
MSHLDILLPFSLPPPAMAPDLLRAMQTPSLAMLLARSNLLHSDSHDPYARALPHEFWLAQAIGLPFDAAAANTPPVALHAMQQRGVATPPGIWFMLHPVHIHIARDHLVLTDRRRLALSEVDARALFTLAAPLFEEIGQELVYGDADHWFLRADSWRELITATPDAACGHNIDIWMPKGPGERDWRKVQNEIQMHWHDSAVNRAREEAGLNPVNSLWLWGAAQAPMIMHKSEYSALFLGTDTDAATVLAARPQRGLLMLDGLIEPALGEDLNEWLMRINQLEATWFAPLLRALQDGVFDRYRLILTSGTVSVERSVSRHGLRKFWRKPSLDGLLA